jgi:hypothetical protein
MSPADFAAVVAEPRRKQGLPERVEDQDVLTEAAAMVAARLLAGVDREHDDGLPVPPAAKPARARRKAAS